MVSLSLEEVINSAPVGTLYVCVDGALLTPCKTDCSKQTCMACE